MKIIADFSRSIGQMKPMHGVNDAPFSGGIENSMFHYLKDAGIPYARLHDVGGNYGGFRFVDIPNIFRDETKDVYDEGAYDFTFTDWLLTSLVKQNTIPFFRLGVSIETAQAMKAYRIYPPKDMAKWARVCEMIVRHYNEGWNNGYHMGIKYWEIWNEPENAHPHGNNAMWKGTKEEYFKLYDIASKHLKEQFPEICIGGYGGCGFYGIDEYKYEGDELLTNRYRMEFFYDFLHFVKENNCPMDFFSWHSYESVETTIKFAKLVRETLDRYGFVETQSILDEWNVNSPWNTDHAKLPRHSAKAAADVAAMMCAMQKEGVDMCCYYQASTRVSNFGGLFNPYTKEPFKTYHVFRMFHELYKLGDETLLQIKGQEKVYAVSAADEKAGRILIANLSGKELDVTVQAQGLFTNAYVMDEENDYGETAPEGDIRVKPDSVWLLQYRR